MTKQKHTYVLKLIVPHRNGKNKLEGPNVIAIADKYIHNCE